MAQYYVGVPPMQRSSQWSTGLFDCFSDCGTSCITCCCPCITFGKVAEIVDNGVSSCGTTGAIYCLIMACSYGACQWIYSCCYRTRMRSAYGLPESLCPDCCVHFCCEPCALCQMHRELKNRGFDMDIVCRSGSDLDLVLFIVFFLESGEISGEFSSDPENFGKPLISPSLMHDEASKS